MPCLLLIVTLRLTCGEMKIRESIKESQNIMSMIVVVLNILQKWLEVFCIIKLCIRPFIKILREFNLTL